MARDVDVEGFCMSSCCTHGSSASKNGAAYVWVGDSLSEYPGQCAWPFHQPEYGPQTTPLMAPNGDVGTDGMVINVAALVEAAVTNPFKGGFYQGSGNAPVEVGSACTGVFAKGALCGLDLNRARVRHCRAHALRRRPCAVPLDGAQRLWGGGRRGARSRRPEERRETGEEKRGAEERRGKMDAEERRRREERRETGKRDGEEGRGREKRRRRRGKREEGRWTRKREEEEKREG